MPTERKLAIVGAGGMAREVAWMLRRIGPAVGNLRLVGHVVTDPRYVPSEPTPIPVGTLQALVEWGVEVAVIAIGDAKVRERVALEAAAVSPSLEWPALIDPQAVVADDSVYLGDGVILAPSCVVSVDVHLAAFSFVNYGATIGHGARVGAGSIISPGANVAGDVVVGKGVLVGSGAQVLRYVTIGDGAVVGAGAVVTRDVAAGEVVVGVPARPILKNDHSLADG